jgi:O-antigen/teichoic acid export membrane protein
MRLRISLAWSFSQQTINFVLQFAASIVIARLLAPEEVGVFALAMAAHVLAGAFKELGITSYLVREPTLTSDKIRTAFGLWILIAWITGLLLLLVRWPIAQFLEHPGIADVLAVISLSFFAMPFGQPANALLVRNMRFDVLHHIKLTSAVLGIATSISLAWLGLSYMALAWGAVATSLSTSALLICAHPDHLKLTPSLRHWRTILHFGGYLTGASTISTLTGEGLKIILGASTNPAAVALFERSLRLPAAFRQTLLSPLGQVLLPNYSESIRNSRPIGPTVEKVIATTTIILWPAFLSLGICATPVILTLFGDNWRIAGVILPEILLAQSITSIFPQAQQILVAHGKVRRVFWLSLATAPPTVALAAIGAMHSLEMFAALRPLQALIFSVSTYFCVRDFWGTSLRAIGPLYLQAAVSALITALPSFLAHSYFGETMPLHILVYVGLSTPFAWLCSLYLVRSGLCIEINRMLRNIPVRNISGRTR